MDSMNDFLKSPYGGIVIAMVMLMASYASAATINYTSGALTCWYTMFSLASGVGAIVAIICVFVMERP